MQRILLTATLFAAIAAIGCRDFTSSSAFKLPFSDPEDAVVENVKDALSGHEGHSRLVGDYISIRRGLKMYVVEGVGLVVGLQGTGGDVGPPYREMILEEMRKRRFPRPEEFLRSTDTALVVVRAYIPPLVRKGDTLDVEVRIPEGSEATSLRGGSLLACDLTELAYAPGRGAMQGHIMAHASGAILSAQLASDSSSGAILRGQIPAGGRYVGEDRDMSVELRREYANHRMSTRIAKRVSDRFYDYDRSGIQRPLATAKTDSQLELKLHSRYRDNYPRYLQCVRHIALRESSVEKNLRMKQMLGDLQFGPTAQLAALQYEAIGSEAIPFLKKGLQSSDFEAQFHSAESLAYLGDTSGLPVLVKAIDEEPAFRVFALAAAAATMSPEATIQLQPLLSHDSQETRYGAFRAMTTIAPEDGAVAGRKMRGEYMLHVLNTQGPPLVHVTQRHKAEVVVFGVDQKLRTPAVLRAGRYIMIRSAPTGEKLHLALLAPDQPERRMEVSTRIEELIRAVDQLGGTYPDVVQMLVEAKSQGNLPGSLGIDALPRAGRVYTRPGSEAAEQEAETEVGGSGDTPNLFQSDDPSQSEVEQPEDPELAPQEDLGPVGFTVE